MTFLYPQGIHTDLEGAVAAVQYPNALSSMMLHGSRAEAPAVVLFLAEILVRSSASFF